MDANRSDVLIVGGGVVGLACALYLLEAGVGVRVLERATAGGATSHGNCGTITPSHAMPLAMPGMVRKALAYMREPDAPFYLKPRFDPELARWLFAFMRRCNWEHFRQVTRVKARLLETSRDALEKLVDDHALDCEFEALGTLYVYRDERAFAESRWIPEALAEVDLPIRTLSGDEARELEPSVNESIIGGYFNPRDAHLRPNRYLAELARRVRELGGDIVEHANVTTIEPGEPFRARTAGATYSAPRAIVALGSWTRDVQRALGVSLPIQPGKGYSITYARPNLAPRIPVTLKERQVCVTAWPSGFRLGSTMEFSGYDASLNPVRLAALERAAAEYLREPPSGPRLEEWFGWRPMTWDDLPIIGPVPKHRNVLLATGHGMLGVTMSAVTGLVVRDLVLGREPVIDVAPYAPTRF